MPSSTNGMRLPVSTAVSAVLAIDGWIIFVLRPDALSPGWPFVLAVLAVLLLGFRLLVVRRHWVTLDKVNVVLVALPTLMFLLFTAVAVAVGSETTDFGGGARQAQQRSSSVVTGKATVTDRFAVAPASHEPVWPSRSRLWLCGSW